MVGKIEVLGRERLRAVGAMMTAEANSWHLRRDLGAGIREVAGPIVDAQKVRVKAIPSNGITEEPIREAVVGSLGINIRFSGYQAGVTITAKQTPNVRGFAMAPRRLNARRGWRHPFFGDKSRWYQQYGDPGWFSEPPFEHLAEFNAAALAAVVAMEARIISKAKAIP